MKTNLLVIVGLLGGCFSDSGNEGEAGTEGTGITTGSAGTADGTTTAGSGSAGGSTTGSTGMDGSGSTNDTGSTGIDTTGSTGTDLGSAGTDGIMCETNFDCIEVEVCSAGLGECIPADAAVYQVTVDFVSISGGPECAGDPDEKYIPCDQEVYIKALVGNVVVHQSPPVGVDYSQVVSLQFLANLSTSETFTFQIWDSDANENDLIDDLLFTKTFNTPAAVLHLGQLSDMWMEGAIFKHVILAVRAQ